MQKYDPRNSKLKVYVNGRIVPRDEASVSVFDSVVQGGDAVWEGLRVYEGGRIFRLAKHLQRLQESAHALAFEKIPEEGEIRDAIRSTLAVNKMQNDSHIRLTLTRGEKITSGMDPRLNQSGCSLIVLAEWKPPIYPAGGIKLITSSVRRNTPSTLDSKIHHANLLNNILAKIEANVAGADDAIMLDLDGFIAETNATNIFMVKSGTLFTPRADACLPGITRGTLLDIASQLEISAIEDRISLSTLYNASEVFTTGTMGELTHVLEVDGRKIQSGATPVLDKLQLRFAEITGKEAEVI